MKCPSCGLVNWADAESCKRCGAELSHVSQLTPPVWKWFVSYCILMALLYLALAGLGFAYLLAEPAKLDVDSTEAEILGPVFIVAGLLLFVPFVSAPFLPRKPWVWTFDLILICIGLTSACCLPAAIPLLIFWLKPETKSFFGRD